MSATDRIITVLTQSKKPLFLWEIQDAIFRRYRERHETTAISARIRDEVRSRLKSDGFAITKMKPKGKQAYVYWITHL